MKPKYFLLILFLFSLSIEHLTFNISYATVRYVSKTGSSSPPYTSWQTAADSIQKCINYCAAGDTVYVANGTYKENLVINKVLALIGSSMDSTVIDGRGLGDYTVFSNNDFTIKGFKVYGRGKTYGNSFVFFSDDKFIEIKNCKIQEAFLAIFVSYSCLIDNVVIKNTLDGTYCGQYNNSNIEVKNSLILIDAEDSDGIGAGAGIHHITNNIILYTGILNQNPGTGISITVPRKVYIYNNLISGFNTNINFQIHIDSASIKNNILRNSKSDYSIWSMNDDPIIRNNIIKSNAKGIYGWTVDSDFNLFWKNVLDYNNSIYGDSDLVADPMFVNDTIPAAEGGYDFHLQKYSPAIDRGNPDILDVDGSRSDIGMYGGPFGERYTYQDLSPKPPGNVTASYQNNSIQLKWNKNTEADFSHYRIYRDTVANFIYDISKKIGETSDTVYADNLHYGNKEKNYYYKLTGYDKQGNQSAASEEIRIVVTGLGEIPPKVVEEYKLMNNYPNPFNPSTKIPYRLKEGGYVKVMVYNILGEMVKVLVNGYQSKGYYEIEFNPNETERKQSEEGFPGMETWQHSNYVSGVYLLRIEVIGEGNIPVFSDMRKMMLVK